MKRGVLELSREEFNSLVSTIKVENFSGSALETKLRAGASSIEPILKIELSEEELEILLDELGAPLPTDDQALVSAKRKVSDMLLKFRSL